MIAAAQVRAARALASASADASAPHTEVHSDAPPPPASTTWKSVLPPLRGALHTLLILLVTYQLTLFNAVSGVTHRSLGQAFHTLLLPPDPYGANGDAADNPTADRVFLFDTGAVVSALTLMSDRYWSLPTLTTITLVLPTNDTTDPGHGLPTPSVEWVRLAGPIQPGAALPSLDSLSTTVDMEWAGVFPLTAGGGALPGGAPLGANATAFKSFCASLLSLRYSFHFRTREPVSGGGDVVNRVTRQWRLQLTFDFSSRGHFEVLNDYSLVGELSGTDGGEAGDSASVVVAEWDALAAVTLVLVLIHVGLVGARGAWRWRAFFRARKALAGSDAPLTLSDGTALVDGWSVCGVVGACLLGYHCCVSLQSRGGMGGDAQGTTLGVACVALWLSGLTLLSSYPTLASNPLTLRLSTPTVLRFLLGVLPIFLAYWTFSITVFGTRSVRYSTPGGAAMTLFSFLNGDALRETFTHTEVGGMRGGSLAGSWASTNVAVLVVADVMLVTLILLFYHVVMNVVVAISAWKGLGGDWGRCLISGCAHVPPPPPFQLRKRFSPCLDPPSTNCAPRLGGVFNRCGIEWRRRGRSEDVPCSNLLLPSRHSTRPRFSTGRVFPRRRTLFARTITTASNWSNSFGSLHPSSRGSRCPPRCAPGQPARAAPPRTPQSATARCRWRAACTRPPRGGNRRPARGPPSPPAACACRGRGCAPCTAPTTVSGRRRTLPGFLRRVGAAPPRSTRSAAP